MPEAARAVQVRRLGVQPVERRLLPGHDDVDVVGARQAVLHGGEQRVGVRRQVDADDLGPLVDHVVDEAGVLVGEPVVVLAPDVRGEQVVERRDGRAPLDLPGRLQPLGVLVDHRVDEVDERLVAAEDAVPAGQQVALQPALAGVLGEHLHDPAAAGQVLVDVEDLAGEHLVGHLVDGVEPVGGGLVGAEDPEVVRVVPHHVDQVAAELAGGLVDASRPAPRRRTAWSRKSGSRSGRRSRPPLACGLALIRRVPAGARARSRSTSRPSSVEQLLGDVGPEPLLELGAVPVVLTGVGKRHLVGPPGALDQHAVDLVRPGPALRGDQQDHRPRPPLGVAVLAGGPLDLADRVVGPVERGRELPVHVGGVVALDGQHLVAVAAQQALELLARDPRRDGRVGDLVAVEVQDRQDRAVGDRVDELVGVPRGGERPGLELAVAHHRGHQQVGVVHRGAVRVREHVAELAALVDGAGRLGRDVAGDAAGERELPEQRTQSLLVVADVRVDLAVRALQPGVRHGRRAAVARAGEEDRVDVALADQPVEVGPQQVEARRRSPVAEQPGLDVLAHERPPDQRVVEQVDLSHRHVVGGAPPGVQVAQLVVGQGGHGTPRVGGRMSSAIGPREQQHPGHDQRRDLDELQDDVHQMCPGPGSRHAPQARYRTSWSARDVRRAAGRAGRGPRRRTPPRLRCPGGRPTRATADRRREHELARVERPKDEPTDAQPDPQRHVGRAELQRRLEERDGQDHAQPDECRRNGDGSLLRSPAPDTLVVGLRDVQPEPAPGDDLRLELDDVVLRRGRPTAARSGRRRGAPRPRRAGAAGRGRRRTRRSGRHASRSRTRRRTGATAASSLLPEAVRISSERLSTT